LGIGIRNKQISSSGRKLGNTGSIDHLKMVEKPHVQEGSTGGFI